MGFFGPDDGRMQENVGERSERHGPLVAVHEEDAGAYQNIARVERITAERKEPSFLRPEA
jgi:hypothetical protein